jgi:hypothetical protein
MGLPDLEEVAAEVG